jgi:hypothetical protein
MVSPAPCACTVINDCIAVNFVLTRAHSVVW